MRHCCEFTPDVVYCLKETDLYIEGKLYMGICPSCGKLVLEICDIRFDGAVKKLLFAGAKAAEFMQKIKDRILYAFEGNKPPSKPYGWRYGVNKEFVCNGKTYVKQYAYDFYGNKEIVKVL